MINKAVLTADECVLVGPISRILPVGDFHGTEVPFVFDNVNINPLKHWPTRGDKQGMGNIMSCLWASFAYSGSPNGAAGKMPLNCTDTHDKLPTWPSFGSQRFFFSLNDEAGNHSKVRELQADNNYPDDEWPSDKRCDMWMALKSGSPWFDGRHFKL